MCLRHHPFFLGVVPSRVRRVCDSVSHSPETLCGATPTDAEALALRDSAQHRQGELRRNLRCISMGASRVILPQPSRGKRGYNFNGNDYANLLGGGRCLVVLPPCLKNMHYACLLHAKGEVQSDEAKATMPHVKAVILLCLERHSLRGNLIRILRTLL